MNYEASYPQNQAVSPQNQVHYNPNGQLRHVNKTTYILVCFFIGGIGVHRFMRGQTTLGLLMLFFNWLTLGIWSFADFIISLVKLGEYKGENFVFTQNGDWAPQQ